MPIDQIITSPLLTPALETANATLVQTQTLIDLLSQNAASPPSTDLTHTILRHQKLLSAYLSKLRLQTRRAAYTARVTKSETADARKHVDGLLLQLQNLYYEQRHLLGEIASCEDYNHAYRELPLIEEWEYLERFPEQEGLSEMELMPQRIEYELAERNRMEEERGELIKIKEQLVAENTRRKEEMKKMDEKLEGWVDGLGKLEAEMTREL